MKNDMELMEKSLANFKINNKGCLFCNQEIFEYVAIDDFPTYYCYGICVDCRMLEDIVEKMNNAVIEVRDDNKKEFKEKMKIIKIKGSDG